MKGLFEVHLITTPEYQSQLFGFITNLNDTRIIRPRPTCAYALYGDYPNQPMLTFWVNGFVDEVTNIVNDIKTDITEIMPIIRTKIEAMAHNEGVPLPCTVCTEDHYFEYHFKVPITSTSEWNALVNIITPYGAHLFYNPYNKNLTPIVTIRRYTSLDALDIVYHDVIKLLEDNHFTHTELEKEYSVYDSNVNLDKNWLFSGKRDQFITTIDDKMVFHI
jgi:hypothetical protein